MADDAGALLVRSGLVTASALDDARAKVGDLGGTLGEQLVAAGVVSDNGLTDFYKTRLLVPQVNPNTLARLPAKVVAVIPSDMAIELRAIPVSLDGDNNLTIAMSDPSDRHAVDEIAFFTGAYVVRAVATQMQIAWCLAHYYGHVTHLGQRLLKEGGAPPQQPRKRADSQPRPRTKGITGKVEAMRHRGLVPGVASLPPSGSGGVDDKANSLERQEIEHDDVRDTQKVMVVQGEPTPVDTPRARTASGEIRAPMPRAASIKPPLVIDDSGPIVAMEPYELETSGPVITIEAGDDDDDDDDFDSEPEITVEPAFEDATDPKLAVPRRKRPAEPDPPELAARAGEVQLATGSPIKKIEFDEPAVVIDEDLEAEAADPASRRRTSQMDSVEASGEVRIREERPPALAEETNIFVELGDDDAPAIIHDSRVDESAPVLLVRRRASDAPTDVTHSAAPAAAIENETSDVVVLDAPKQPAAGMLRNRVTQMGIGPAAAAARERVLESASVPSEIDDQPTDAARRVHDNDPTRVDAYAAPARDDDTSDELIAAPPGPFAGRDTSPHLAIAPNASKAVPPPSGQIKFDKVRPAPARDDDDEDEVARSKPTMVMSAVELDEVIPGRSSDVLPGHLGTKVNFDPSDEGWGEPGTTIPPPLLGAIPGSLAPRSGIIPLPDVDSAPLMVTPPSPPERGGRAQSVTEAGMSRALEAATARVLELIHTLDHTTNRDQVVAVMIAHLAETHHRAGFFAARGGELSLFAITPRVPAMPAAALRLDRPSTLQDVVGTRLPYRGPMHDDISRLFLTATLGACPPEILLVPVSVRERVVGVLFGDHRMKHTFDDQLALAARAAGMALERILKAKRGES